ncbi:hypothetical protein T05_1789 [Trichinella murrelli]|uniref:Uncharacterized protein n=1 Tax=Trichinella murrelli TaxID=144512 RepID=A0A0V0T0J6_9BILA|nr:hypothetical protein T05_1789 [Trichinella murrelli]
MWLTRNKSLTARSRTIKEKKYVRFLVRLDSVRLNLKGRRYSYVKLSYLSLLYEKCDKYFYRP